MVIKLVSLIPIINVCLCLGLGVFTFSRNPKHVSNIGFLLGMLSLAILNAGDATLLFAGDSHNRAILGTQLSIVGQSLLPPSLLLFSVVFARSERRSALIRWLPILLVTALASIIFIYLMVTDAFISISQFNLTEDYWGTSYRKDARLTLGAIGYCFYIYFIVGTILCLANLELTFRSSKGLKRLQIKYVIFCFGGILIFFVSILPARSYSF